MTVTVPTQAASALDEVMDSVAERVNQGMQVSQAVDDLLPQITLDSDTYTTLARYGLIRYCNDRLHLMRTGHGNAFRSRFMVRRLSGAAARADILRRVVLSGADGMVKPLSAFTLADCRVFMDTADGQINGWTKKRDTIRYINTALEEAGVAQVEDLPDEAVEHIAQMVDDAWTWT